MHVPERPGWWRSDRYWSILDIGRSDARDTADMAIHCLNALHKLEPRLYVVNVGGCYGESMVASVPMKKEAVQWLPLIHDLISVRPFMYLPYTPH